MRLLAFIILLFCAVPAVAGGYTHAIGYICCSHHDVEGDFNGQNEGLFYRRNIDGGYMAFVSAYENSEYRQTVFIGAGPRTNISDDFEVSIPIGLASGYQSTAILFALPTITYRDTINLHGIPGIIYALSIQVTF